jgi:membrane carboxypeptidase/penicillin-binding protein
VWVGYPQAEVPMTSTRIGSVTGGSWPAQIWQAFMSPALSGTPPSDFTSPSGLTYVTIDTRSGCVAASGTPTEYQASTPFTPGTEPTNVCVIPDPEPDKKKKKRDDGGRNPDNPGRGNGNGNGDRGDDD